MSIKQYLDEKATLLVSTHSRYTRNIKVCQNSTSNAIWSATRVGDRVNGGSSKRRECLLDFDKHDIDTTAFSILRTLKQTVLQLNTEMASFIRKAITCFDENVCVILAKNLSKQLCHVLNIILTISFMYFVSNYAFRLVILCQYWFLIHNKK